MSKRVTQLTELTTPAIDDYLPIVDTSTGITKKISYRNLVNIPELGWTSAGETWVYASATTFTVAGVDVTGKYPVGTKIRLKQGGSYKYFYIVARVFSTNTTITVAAGSDYSLANSAITDNYFSYAEVATGFPDYFNYTPSVTNMTVGNGSSIMYYNQVGKTVTARYRFLLGTTSAISTNPTISLPIQAAATYLGNDVIGDGIAFTGGQWKLSPVFVNVNTFRPMLWQAGGTYVSGITAFTSSIPSGAWIATDSFLVNLRYQAA